jgi:hypothetical protein
LDKTHYFLDFAVFCHEGRIDVEADGDKWHAQPERIPLDNLRDNAIQAAGWRILRFNGHHIREALEEYCVREITKMITKLGGISEGRLVPRVLYPTSEGVVQQLTMFEDAEAYDLD